MKKVAVISSLAIGIGLLAAPAMAQTGHVGLNYSNVDVDGLGDTDTIGVDGAVAFAAGGLTVKLDGSFADNDDSNTETFGATAHVMSLNDNQAFGGFLGYVDTDVDSGYVLGGEYAKFFSGSTLAIGAGYGNIDDADVDLYGLNAEYRIFATDNLRFDLGAGWLNADGAGGDADAITLGAGVEYRFGSSPVSIGGSYQFVDVDDFGVEADVFAVTLRFDFGNGTLKGRDRNGSSTFGALGGFGGAVSLF